MINLVSRLCIFILLLSACSSKPQKNYQVTTLQSISYSLLDLADRKRQLQQYEQALLLYRETESYALKRNDKLTAGLSQLKRAAIYIQLGQPETALALIEDVERWVAFENVPLAQAVTLLRAQYARLMNDVPQALSLLKDLRVQFQQDPEKHSYYRVLAWSYDPASTSLVDVENDIALLSERKQTHKLNNIEIYSYAIFQYAKYLVERGDDKAEGVLTTAIAHFSEVELSNKIIQCYELAASFYQRRAQAEKATYYREQAHRILALLSSD